METIVFEQDNKQVIQIDEHFFTRVFEGEDVFESGDYNTLDRAKDSLGIKLTAEDCNKLIAKFMGLNNRNPNTILYHSDWNWLMEVVDKIESLRDDDNNGFYYVEIYTSSCIIFNNGDYLNEIVSTTEETKIKAVYNACLEFIRL